jgi:hypothetical protein
MFGRLNVILGVLGNNDSVGESTFRSATARFGDQIAAPVRLATRRVIQGPARGDEYGVAVVPLKGRVGGRRFCGFLSPISFAIASAASKSTRAFAACTPTFGADVAFRI